MVDQGSLLLASRQANPLGWSAMLNTTYLKGDYLNAVGPEFTLTDERVVNIHEEGLSFSDFDR